MLESRLMSELIETKELSEREIEVLRLLAAGLSNKEIAGQLSLSVNTVKVHLRNIFGKLGVQSRTEATLAAIQRGWVASPAPETGPAGRDMIYTPSELPQIVFEPPLPLWRRAVLLFAVIVAIAGVVVSGAAANSAPSVGAGIFSDRPIVADPGQAAIDETLWQPAAPMQAARTRLAVAVYQGRLLVVGGDTQNGATGEVEWFDPLKDEWQTAAPKPEAVSNIAAVVIGDRVIVPGGTAAADTPTSAVEIYDARRDSWSSAAPLPAPRMAYALAAFDGRAYLFGGWDGATYSARTFVYDPATDVWSARASMSAPRGFAAAATLGDAIYVVGGFDGQVESNVCERYLPREDRWEKCPAMSVGRGGLALVAVGGGLYAIGGGWTGYLAFNESYTPGATSWRALPTPFIGQWRGLGAAVVDSEIIAVGGWNGQYLAVTERYSPFPFKVFVPATQGESQP